MIYSKSEGITEAECIAIKDAMQYNAPIELSFTPTAEEISDVFPYSYAYFILPTGRGCVAQSTYIGRDYSGRFGNYIIYAMVFDIDELPCNPSEFFGELYIKTNMTQEELDAPSPVPPLPPMEIIDYGSVINDDQLNEFVFDKEAELAQLLTLVLNARDRKAPFYLNDTRENLVLWCAAIQRILPPSLARKFTYNTYMYNQDILKSARVKEEGLDFYVVGVRPDACHFDYSVECRSGIHVVADFLGGHLTEGIPPSAYATAMASSMAMDFEEIDAFGEFVDSISLGEINSGLDNAYIYYRLLRYNEYEHSDDNLHNILSFGAQYCSDECNSDVGGKLMQILQEEGCAVSPNAMLSLWKFIGKYAGYMVYTLYDLLQEATFQYAGDADGPCEDLNALLDELSQTDPQRYKGYLDYVNSASAVDQLLVYLEGHENLHTNCFYIKWLLHNYSMQNALNNREPVGSLYMTLLKNIGCIPNSEKTIMEILFEAADSQLVFKLSLKLFGAAVEDPHRLDRLSNCYVEMVKSLPAEQAERFETMLYDTPEAMPLMLCLFARSIAEAEDPEGEFARVCFSNTMNRFILNTDETPIDPLVIACLENVSEKRRPEAALSMAKDLDQFKLKDPRAIRLIVESINKNGFKALDKVKGPILQRVYKLERELNSIESGRVKAVLTAKRISDDQDRGLRPVGLKAAMVYGDIVLSGFDKSDYEAYIKNYFPVFFALIEDKNDVAVLMQAFYHRQCFTDFAGDYFSTMKKTEKKEPDRWKRLVFWSCSYTLTASRDDQAADELYKPMVRYLRTLDDEELEKLRKKLESDVPKSQCLRLFEEIQRKEGFSEKFGNLFLRK